MNTTNIDGYYVRYAVLAAVVMKSAIFWDRDSQQELFLLPASCWFLAWLIFQL
jgi:hypothetical protein